MTGKDITKFQRIANAKGWKFQDIAERWGKSERQLSRIAKTSDQRDLDAVNGLPDRVNINRGQTMSSKTTELQAAEQKLSELINELVVLERACDQAVEHSANYLGNDERIEEVRDAKAMAALNSVNRVKEQIKAQTQLVQKLASEY